VRVEYQISGYTALQLACAWSATSVAKYLITGGAQVNEMGTTGITPLGTLLHNCARGSRSIVPIMNCLVECGADIYSLDQNKQNVLMYWAYLSELQTLDLQYMAEILLVISSRQFSLTQQNSDGASVWHILACYGNGHEFVNALAAIFSEDEIKNSINMVDEDGRTALHVAAFKGNGKSMQAFIDLGCEVTTRTSAGKTILHLSAAALDVSCLPFEIAVRANWDQETRSSDGAEALIDWAVAFCDDHGLLPVDMPQRLRDAMIKLSDLMPSTSSFTGTLTACVDTMSRMLALYYPHDLASCTVCEASVKCFVVLLQGPDGERTLDSNDLASLKVLSDGLLRWSKDTSLSHDGESICTEAICAIIGSKVCTHDLHRALKDSFIVDVAISARQTRLINNILELNLDVDETGFCSDDLTILQRLCQSSATPSAVQTALSCSRSPRGRTNPGDTLLHLSLRPNNDTLKAPVKAQEAVVKLLIEAGVDVNSRSTSDGKTALILGATLPSPGILKILLENGADVASKDAAGCTALLHACESGRPESVRSLSSSARPFVYGNLRDTRFDQRQILVGPFQAAAFADSTEVLEVLYQLTEIDEAVENQLKVPSCLWVACMWPSRLGQVHYILQKGADVNYRYPHDGTTPLHNAAATGSVDVLKALLEAGSNCCARDHGGLTAEMHASSCGEWEAAEMLRVAALEISASLPAPSKEQRLERLRLRNTIPDSIGSLVVGGDLDQLKNLVTTGSDLSLQFQSCECTPMMVALACGTEEIVAYLQSLGIQMVGTTCRTHHAQQLWIYCLLSSHYSKNCEMC
jgi:ankyrin repeat protein